MGLRFNENYTVDDFTFVLSTRNFHHIAPLVNISEVHYKPNLNASDELSFTVHKEVIVCADENYPDGIRIEPAWDKIQDLRLVWVMDLDEYFQITVEQHDTDSPYKTLTLTSLCEAELGQINLYGLEINTLADWEVDDVEDALKNPESYNVTHFFDNDDPSHSLLHRILSAAPHYSVGHVDVSLAKDTRVREFSIDGTSIYDLLTGQVAEQYECLFTFDTKGRKVNAYDLLTTCKTCGHRGDFHFTCPNELENGTICNSTDLSYFGEDTLIFIDRENLSDDIVYSGTPDEIKNCLKMSSGDDDLNTAIQFCNPNGTLYLYKISEVQEEDMSKELKDALKDYDALCNETYPKNIELVHNLYEKMDEYYYKAHSMMPIPEKEPDDVYTATYQANLLTKTSLSPTGVSNLSEYTNPSLVSTAIKNHAKSIIKSGYFKVEIAEKDEDGNNIEPSYEFEGTDEETNISSGVWYGKLKVTNYSDEEDVVYTDYIRINITSDIETCLKQQINKVVSQRSEDEDSVFQVLSIESLEKFEEALKEYCKARLESFYSALEECVGLIQDSGQAEKTAVLYESVYVPWYQKWVACEKEYNLRCDEVDALEEECADIETSLATIRDSVNLEKFLNSKGKGLYIEFCSYRRDGEYSNNNYTSEGLSNEQILERAQEFIEEAKKQINKSSTNQFTISASLHNLMAIPEFAELIKKFKIGNWIRVGVDGIPYRLRLVSYDLTFGEHQSLNVEFSNLTRCPSVVSDVKSILDSAKGMSTNFSYVSKQAEKGQAAQETIDDWLSTGLNSGLVQIKNGEHQEFTINENGIRGRAYDNITETYSPRELRVRNNVIAFTDDGWASTRMVIGEHSYDKYDSSTNRWIIGSGYGNTSDFVTAGHVTGATIVGGKVYSRNYSDGTNGIIANGTFVDLDKGSFSFAGGRLTYDGDDEILLSDVTINWGSVNMPDIEDMTDLNQALTGMNNSIAALYEGLQFTSISDQYVIAPNIVGGQLSIVGKDGSYATIDQNGVLSCNGAIFKGANCFNFDASNGTMTIGDMTQESLGENIKIATNGITLNNGTTTVASFSENAINLGLNSTTSMIGLCGQTGTISTYVDSEGFSEGLYMSSTRLALGSSYEGEGAITNGNILINPQAFAELDTPNSYIKIQTDYTDESGNVSYSSIGAHAGAGGSTISFSTMDYSLSLDFRGLVTGAPILLYSGSSIRGYDSNEQEYELLRLGGDESTPICIVGDGVYGHSTAYTNICGGTGVYLKTTKSTGVAYIHSDNAFRPLPDGTTSLGTPDHRWGSIYTINGTIQTSDLREKENIKPLNTSELFDKLKPVQFNFINGDGKISYGLIAQDVVTAMEEIGISESELSLIYHDKWIDKENNVNRDCYGLGYNNLIAMLIYEVQKLKIAFSNKEDL